MDTTPDTIIAMVLITIFLTVIFWSIGKVKQKTAIIKSYSYRQDPWNYQNPKWVELEQKYYNTKHYDEK